MRYFITGTAGFIGFHLARHLLRDGHEVYGFDALTEYYDVALKRDRLKLLQEAGTYHHTTARLEDAAAVAAAYEASEAEIIIHLAAQAGVRYSLENPRAYVDTNIVGSYNVLEAARKRPPGHLMLASTSSVYGANEKTPFAETDKTDEPLTLYAASKKSMEVMGHAYAHLWKIPTTVFRFFTVYGPYGRPDMALFKFVDAVRKGEAIDVYGHGQMRRDFTYVDDLIASIISLVPVIPAIPEGEIPEGDTLSGDTLSSQGPYRIVNMGGGQPVELMAFISTIEAILGKEALMNMMPMQKGDVPQTFASTELLYSLTGVRPETSLDNGVRAFVEWFESYYN